MWAQVDRILRQATTQIADHIANFLPGLLVSLMLMLATFVVALLARMLLVRALRGLDFDRRAEQSGLAALVGWPASTSPSQTVARVVYWTILILGLLVSLTALNATIPSRLALSVFEYVPHLLAALMILVVGAVAARFLARSALIGAVNMQIRSARLLSLARQVAGAARRGGDGPRSSRHRPDACCCWPSRFSSAASSSPPRWPSGSARETSSRRTIERQLREPPPSDDKVNHV